MANLSEDQLAELNEVLAQFPEHQREEKKKEILAQVEQQQSQPQQCPFCLMAEGQIKTTPVYEDSLFMAVLEINPANPGHVILFPKKHYHTLTELTEEEQEKFFQIAKKLNVAILKIAEGSSLVLSSGKVTGVKFPHLMFNIIPRVSGDEVFLTWKPKKVTPEDLAKFRDLIVKNIPTKKEIEKPREPLDTNKLKASFERLSRRIPR